MVGSLFEGVIFNLTYPQMKWRESLCYCDYGKLFSLPHLKTQTKESNIYKSKRVENPNVKLN